MRGARFDRDVNFAANDPEVAASRFDLTGQYGDQLITDLENAFGSNGNPATRDQIDELVSGLQGSGLSIEDFRRKLKKEQGKYNIAQALAIASHKGAGGSENPSQQEVQEIDLSTQPQISGKEPSSDSPDYGVIAQGDDSHHKGQPAVISVSIVNKQILVAILNNISVLVTKRETDPDGTVHLTYAVREKRAFRLKGMRMRMFLPDTLSAKLEPGSGSR